MLKPKDRINPIKRQKRLDLLTKQAKLLRKKIDLGQINELELDELEKCIEEIKMLKRIDRASKDFSYFAYQYLSADMNPDNPDVLIPEGQSLETISDFHRELCDMIDDVIDGNSTRIAITAPRGFAKSSYFSNVFPLYSIVFELEKYIIICSETISLSIKLIDWVANQLKTNELLRHDFGELLNPKGNLKDNATAFVTANKIMLEAVGSKAQVRGKRYQSSRPTAIICDDMESDGSCATEQLREKAKDWFTRTLLPALHDQRKSKVMFVGTMIHTDSLLSMVMNRHDFNSKLYKAIVQDSDNMDLWNEFTEIFNNIDNPNAYEEAMDFYEVNENAMNEGAEVLWNDKYSYLELQIERCISPKAFYSELMNTPSDGEEQKFSNFTYFDYDDLTDKKLDYFSVFDPSVGKAKSKRKDYNAIIVLARNRDTGVLYVVDTWMKKCPTSQAIQQCFRFMEEYPIKVFGVESVGFQYSVFEQIRNEAVKRGIYSTKFREINTRQNKEEKIGSLEPLVERGVIRFIKNQHGLISQLKEFPYGKHDDLADALAMVVTNLIGTKRKIRTWDRKPKGL